MITLTSFGWKSGLREWILQRFSGLYIGFYFLFILFYLLFFGGFSYLNWIFLFSYFLFKIATILFIFNLVLHSSIGMSIVFTDYISNMLLRIILDFIVNLVLLSYVFYIMQILWSFK